ncbi:MAG: glycoside hydrolase 43 family protein [Bacteroidales bacterium]|nr:glycoside hydrolase 43 family protein [Bacteroidales bacterium]
MRLPAKNPMTSWGDQGNGSYINPILNADYSDPDVIRVADKYYMVASDFHFLGMQVLESDDMVNWKYVSQIYTRFDSPEWEKNERYAGGSWAPSIRYHDGQFWVFFCTPDEGLFMSHAPQAAGPWSPLHLVASVPKWEDPCPFWDEDGQAYLGRSQHGAGPIIIHKMSPDGTKLLDDGVTVYQGPVAEGTKIHKWNGYYYISIPEGGVGGGWQTILRSKNIYGPYESRRVLEQGSTDVNGPHQGAIVDTPDGKWMFFHFQSDRMLGRVVHLQPMHWQDGWPVIGVDIDRNGIGEPVLSWQKPVPGTEPFAPRTDDDFSGPGLALQWQFNHNPVDSAWSLEEKPGSLTLHALKAETFPLARNTVTQKTMGYLGEITTVMNLSGMAEGQRCGLACMGMENYLLGVRMENGRKILYLSRQTRIPRTKDTETRETDLSDVRKKAVYLRLSLDFKREVFQFSYSFDNKDFTPVGDAFYVHFGNWKGPRAALYCYNTLRDAGTVSFDWFRYSHDGPKGLLSLE